MVGIMPAGGVPLGPELFDEDVRRETLEGAGAVLDAGCCVRGGEGGFFGEADEGVEVFGVGGPDC